MTCSGGGSLVKCRGGTETIFRMIPRLRESLRPPGAYYRNLGPSCTGISCSGISLANESILYLINVRYNLGRLAEHEEQRDEDQDARQVVLSQLPAYRIPVPNQVLAVSNDGRLRRQHRMRRRGIARCDCSDCAGSWDT